MVSFISGLVVPVLALVSLGNAFDFDSVSHRAVPVAHPKLSAVTVRSLLQSREEAFKPKQEATHHYAEETPSLSGGRSRFSKTITTYKLPALVLEDIEMVVGGIQCTQSSITVQFPDSQTLDSFRPSWDNLGAFFIISAHPGCNADGERAPYLVSGIHYDLQKKTAEFAVERIDFKDAYKTMTVKFGSQIGQYPESSFRTHEGLRKRQLIPSLSFSMPATVQSPTFSRPATPTATPKPSNPQPTDNNDRFLTAHGDIAKGLNGTRFNPNQVLFEQTFPAAGGNGVESVKVACKECAIGGTVDIVDGEFTLSDESNPLTASVDFLNDGFLRAMVNNMTAHIALEASLKLSSKKEFERTIIEVGIPGFSIPGIVTIGPIFRPVFTSSIELVGELDFSTGFDIKVPDNSTITLGIAEVQNSTVSGFQRTGVKAIPFQATSASVTLALTAGIRLDLVFGLSFFNGQGKADVGAFFNIPTLKVSISTGTNLDENCKPVVANASTPTTDIVPFKFPSLVLVEFVVILDVGVQAQFDINFPGIDLGTQAMKEIAATTFDLAALCLSFDKEKTRFVKPTVPVTSSARRPTITNSPGTRFELRPNGTSSELPKSMNGSGKARGDAGSSLWWSGAGLVSVFCVALVL
ncbi:hypothetical protein HYFRA_00013210 [Hymenoscyphus fraxineus]|uniref:GPI anchored protein n=1 Tax=Hymenoscyphus fraxineus TaxID=746836 RepID=A0A9N9PZS3_9HELO|nr:hypothetical protein HYFRA_00013210 [Hymenoscyphus fraxineus]